MPGPLSCPQGTSSLPDHLASLLLRRRGILAILNSQGKSASCGRGDGGNEERRPSYARQKIFRGKIGTPMGINLIEPPERGRTLSGP
jgi:hypothetical protein